MKLTQAIIGFRVKSGWATAVLLAGSARSPHVVDHRIVNLSDPNVPESKQPYHARTGTLEEDSAKVRRRMKVVQRVVVKSVADLVKSYRDSGYKIFSAALVVGSQIDPSSIGNQHIRAHALEGRLFRTVLEKAVRSHRVPVEVTVERDLYSNAKAALARSENNLKRAVTDLGRSLDGPWRAEEKVAALAAWMMLSEK